MLFTKARPRIHLQLSRSQWLLFVFWISGLVLGTCFATAASKHYLLMMRMAPQSHVTIVGLAVTVLLPFLSSAFAVYKDRLWLVYPICFAKVFAFASCGYGITAAFGSAGWLVRLLLQFSDILTMPILCWFVLRHISGRKMVLKRDFGICLGLEVIICCLDLWYISPFLSTITKN